MCLKSTIFNQTFIGLFAKQAEIEFVVVKCPSAFFLGDG